MAFSADFYGSSPLAITYFVQDTPPHNGPKLLSVPRDLCRTMFDVIANECLWCMKLNKLSELSGVSVDASLLYQYNSQDFGATRAARIRTLEQDYYLAANDDGVTYRFQLSALEFESVPVGQDPQEFNLNLFTVSPSIFTLSNVITFSIPHSIVR